MLHSYLFWVYCSYMDEQDVNAYGFYFFGLFDCSDAHRQYPNSIVDLENTFGADIERFFKIFNSFSRI